MILFISRAYYLPIKLKNEKLISPTLDNAKIIPSFILKPIEFIIHTTYNGPNPFKIETYILF